MRKTQRKLKDIKLNKQSNFTNVNHGWIEINNTCISEIVDISNELISSE